MSHVTLTFHENETLQIFTLALSQCCVVAKAYSHDENHGSDSQVPIFKRLLEAFVQS